MVDHGRSSTTPNPAPANPNKRTSSPIPTTSAIYTCPPSGRTTVYVSPEALAAVHLTRSDAAAARSGTHPRMIRALGNIPPRQMTRLKGPRREAASSEGARPVVALAHIDPGHIATTRVLPSWSVKGQEILPTGSQ